MSHPFARISFTKVNFVCLIGGHQGQNSK